MLIFLSQKTIRDKHGFELDALETSYISFFKKECIFSKDTVFLPVPNNVENAADLIRISTPNLIILTGGNNINPGFFGSDVILDDLSHNRDITEQFLFYYAASNAIPILGICRGFHFINVILKGSLTLNINNHPPAVQHSCIFDNKKFIINSFHNHAIFPENIANNLTPVVVDEITGMIEGYAGKIIGEAGISNILGVQWHPERPNTDRSLFKELIERHIFHGRIN